MPKLWKIVSTDGRTTIRVRADDYRQAVRIAKARKIAIRDVVLIEAAPLALVSSQVSP